MKSVKNTRILPLEGTEVESKIFVHHESGRSLDLGALLGFLDRDNQEGIDLQFQRSIKFMSECVAIVLSSNDHNYISNHYPDTLHLLYGLKDALWILGESQASQSETGT